ncbi:hypothetical protein Rs2_48823 [Raphanus sativus]|nr:hypothetical protein Rs2_48823 [Raphanus sativus]
MRKKLALTEILMHLHRRKETWGLHRVLHSKESRLISDVMMSEEGIEDLMILVLLLDTLVIIIPILRRNRGYDRTYHNRREDQPREQSILSRTARSNSNYFRSKAPSFEYRAVERKQTIFSCFRVFPSPSRWRPQECNSSSSD